MKEKSEIRKKACGLFHFKVKTHSRCGNGTVSSVAAAAYRGGTSLYDKRYGRRRTFTRKKEVIVSGIMLPPSAPTAFSNRETLWNAVEESENRIDARLTRELIIALPKQLSIEQNVALITSFLQSMFVNEGAVADWNYHDLWSRPKGQPSAPPIHNPHIHVLLTTRHVDSTGFLGKNRDWDKKDLVPIWRAAWASYCNHALEEAEIDVEIDHRSNKERGLGTPTIHLGRQTAGNAKHWERKRKFNELALATRSCAPETDQIKSTGVQGDQKTSIQETPDMSASLHMEFISPFNRPDQNVAIRPAPSATGRKRRKRKVKPTTDGSGWK